MSPNKQEFLGSPEEIWDRVEYNCSAGALKGLKKTKLNGAGENLSIYSVMGYILKWITLCDMGKPSFKIPEGLSEHPLL